MEIIEHESYPQRVLQDMTAAVLVLNRKGYIKYFNRPAAKLLELDKSMEPGTTRFGLVAGNSENDEFNETILAALYEKKQTHTGKVRYRSPSGKLYYVHISSSFLDFPAQKRMRSSSPSRMRHGKRNCSRRLSIPLRLLPLLSSASLSGCLSMLCGNTLGGLSPRIS